MQTSDPRTSDRGFTLIEVLLAITVSAMAMVAVGGAFLGVLRARHEVENLSQTTVLGERILRMIEDDLAGLWHHNIAKDRVFLGRNMDIGGYDADRMDFLTTTDSVSGAIDTEDQLNYPSVCEVGYWLKENRDVPGLLELYRREDPLVDDDLRTQGKFQLVCDRIKDFNITYYDSLGYQAEEVYEWDSSREHKLPRRIKIEFTVHRKVGNRNQSGSAEVEDMGKILKKYTRHFVFDRRYGDILKAGVAMIPVAPPPPEAAAGGGGGAQGDGGVEGAKGGDGLVSQSTDGPIRGDGKNVTELGPGSRRGSGGGTDRGGLPPGFTPPRGTGGLPPTNPQGLPTDFLDLLRGGRLSGAGGGFPGLGR
ncbi:MAG: prepilin-type N-terminal cleavage/methylation domain-containing protein [Planctomycetes bacterium]|nr:prepilin-type N-terminal cleavage/methylation domain-containing protein [Planctomycetota bacterium]